MADNPNKARKQTEAQKEQHRIILGLSAKTDSKVTAIMQARAAVRRALYRGSPSAYAAAKIKLEDAVNVAYISGSNIPKL